MLPLELLGDRLTSQCSGTEAEQQEEEGWKLRWPFSSVVLDGIKPRREVRGNHTCPCELSECQNFPSNPDNGTWPCHIAGIALQVCHGE